MSARRERQRQIRSKPATTAMVTISDTAPMSGTIPVGKSNVPVEATCSNKAR